MSVFELLAIGLFCGCAFGSIVANVLSYVVPLERVLWFRRASFWLLRAATVALVALVGLVLLG